MKSLVESSEKIVGLETFRKSDGGDSGDRPLIQHNGRISDLARRFGEVAPTLPMFSVNESLVYFDHNRKRQPMSGRAFRSWVERYVTVHGKFDSKSGAPQEESLPLGEAMDVLESPMFKRGVREISAIEDVRLPVIRENGEMELLPWGYDLETKVYTVRGGIEYDTDLSLEQAQEWFEKWFGSMPYHDDRSKAVMVAGLLVLFVRHLPGGSDLRPGFLWEANQAGSGKSICAKACCSIVLGRAPVGSRKSKEEMEKEIGGHLVQKSPVIFMDNLYGSIKSPILDQLITSKLIVLRGMGGQQMLELENDAPVFLTGNELEKNDDAHRRYLQCYLFEKGNPNDRVVENMLDDMVLRRPEWRAEALSALWSMVRTWNEKDRPKGPSTLGSFETFCELLGGVVTCAGYADPIARPEGEEGMSPERQDFYALAKGMMEEMQEEGVDEMLWSYDDMCRIARKLDVFGNLVGDAEHGKQMTIKRDKPDREHWGSVVDCGYMEQKELQPFQKMIKSKIGLEPKFDGVQIVFGDMKREKRKAKLTVKLIEEVDF